jgi:hypothetical protein
MREAISSACPVSTMARLLSRSLGSTVRLHETRLLHTSDGHVLASVDLWQKRALGEIMFFKSDDRANQSRHSPHAWTTPANAA